MPDVMLPGFEAFDHLATMVAVAQPDGHCLLANSTLENVMGLSRRTLLRGNVVDWLVDPAPLRVDDPDDIRWLRACVNCPRKLAAR